MTRMRTIKQAIQSIREQDPGSCFSEWYLRQLVKSGKLKCHRAGNRYLVNMDYLDEFLKAPQIDQEKMQPLGIVRKIKP